MTALVFELAAANVSADPAFVCLVAGEEVEEENGRPPDLRHLVVHFNEMLHGVSKLNFVLLPGNRSRALIGLNPP